MDGVWQGPQWKQMQKAAASMELLDWTTLLVLKNNQLSLTFMYWDWHLKFGPEMVFVNLALSCAFLFCFRGFPVWLLCFVCTASSGLGTGLCLYPNPTQLVSTQAGGQLPAIAWTLPSDRHHIALQEPLWPAGSRSRVVIHVALLLCLCSVPEMTVGPWWIPWFFKGFQIRTLWKLKFAACKILCLVEQERKDSSEVDLFELWYIFHKIDKILF